MKNVGSCAGATPSARLVSDIASTVAARNADGVNLDFEPVPNSLQSQYTTFVREVKAALVGSGVGSYLTVAATGGAAAWDEGYDLAGLTAAGAADAIMVMGYDFSWAGSTVRNRSTHASARRSGTDHAGT